MLRDVLENSWVRAAALAGVLALCGLLAYVLSPVLVSLALAFLVAYMLDPVVDALERRRIRRILAVAIVAVVGLILIIGVPWAMISTVISQSNDLIEAARETDTGQAGGLSGWAGRVLDRLPVEDVVHWLGWDREEPGPQGPLVVPGAPVAEKTDRAAQAPEINARAVFAEHIGKGVRDHVIAFIRAHGGEASVAGKAAGAAASVVTSLGRALLGSLLFLANFAVFAFVACYLLKDYHAVLSSAKSLVPPRYRETTFRIVAAINDQIKGFLRGQMLVCLCLGTMYAIGMLVAGVPFAVPLAFFGMAASIIPYMGVALTIVPATLLTVLQHGVDWHLWVLLIAFFTAQFLEGNVLSPMILGDRIGLHPVWIILAIIVFGSWMGILGMLLAVPIAGALKVLVVEALDRYRRSPFYGGTPPGDGPSPTGQA